jgi:hypothetical protein
VTSMIMVSWEIAWSQFIPASSRPRFQRSEAVGDRETREGAPRYSGRTSARARLTRLLRLGGGSSVVSSRSGNTLESPKRAVKVLVQSNNHLRIRMGRGTSVHSVTILPWMKQRGG